MLIALIRDNNGKPVIDNPKMAQTFYNAKVKKVKKDKDGKDELDAKGNKIIEEIPMMSEDDKAYLRAQFPKELDNVGNA